MKKDTGFKIGVTAGWTMFIVSLLGFFLELYGFREIDTPDFQGAAVLIIPVYILVTTLWSIFYGAIYTLVSNGKADIKYTCIFTLIIAVLSVGFLIVMRQVFHDYTMNAAQYIISFIWLGIHYLIMRNK